jgi:hypothetical protein
MSKANASTRLNANPTNGVTFVMTGNNVNNIIDTNKSNNVQINITAPTTGWNAGIAIWEPTSTGVNDFASGNSVIVNITGVIYAPNASVIYTGNTGSTPTCTQIVAKSIQFGGNNINLSGDCGLPGMKVFGRYAALVE